MATTQSFRLGLPSDCCGECMGRGIYSILQVSPTVRSDCAGEFGLWVWDRNLLPYTQSDYSVAQLFDCTGREVYLYLCIFG